MRSSWAHLSYIFQNLMRFVLKHRLNEPMLNSTDKFWWTSSHSGFDMRLNSEVCLLFEYFGRSRKRPVSLSSDSKSTVGVPHHRCFRFLWYICYDPYVSQSRFSQCCFAFACFVCGDLGARLGHWITSIGRSLFMKVATWAGFCTSVSWVLLMVLVRIDV